MVGIVLQLRKFFAEVYAAQTRIFTNGTETFREDGELLAREVVLLDRFADYFFRDAVGVDVGWRSCTSASSR